MERQSVDGLLVGWLRFSMGARTPEVCGTGYRSPRIVVELSSHYPASSLYRSTFSCANVLPLCDCTAGIEMSRRFCSGNPAYPEALALHQSTADCWLAFCPQLAYPIEFESSIDADSGSCRYCARPLLSHTDIHHFLLFQVHFRIISKLQVGQCGTDLCEIYHCCLCSRSYHLVDEFVSLPFSSLWSSRTYRLVVILAPELMPMETKS